LAIRFVSLPNSPPTSGRPAGASPRLSLVVFTVQAVRLALSRWPTPAPAPAYVRKPSLRSVSLQGPLQRRSPPFCRRPVLRPGNGRLRLCFGYSVCQLAKQPAYLRPAGWRFSPALARSPHRPGGAT
jgi:hypothetical protein